MEEKNYEVQTVETKKAKKGGKKEKILIGIGGVIVGIAGTILAAMGAAALSGNDDGAPQE